MAKRKASNGDNLTGGTKDVNPQYIQSRVTLSAANTFTELELPMPLVRVGPQTSGTVIIMEFLRWYVDMPNIDQDAAAATSRTSGISLTTKSVTAFTTLNSATCIASLRKDTRNCFTAAGTGVLEISTDPMTWDFTDGAGHGILFAGDNLFISAATANFTAAAVFDFKLLYRFKKVSLQEYIGIVQSQS